MYENINLYFLLSLRYFLATLKDEIGNKITNTARKDRHRSASSKSAK